MLVLFQRVQELGAVAQLKLVQCVDWLFKA
jgi:hypothetical protein